jgi:mono/diheme cytochrome c family protein
MLLRVTLAVVVLGAVLAAGAWWLSAPRPLAAADLPDHAGDPAAGERIFHAGGCAACHVAEDDDGDGPPRLAGGHVIETPVGGVVAPNISPDPEHGIGGWTAADFVNAMKRGIAPDGSFYYPAFPWTSYRLMETTDALDLFAYLKTLPAVSGRPEAETAVAFPFSVRRGIGLWKRFAMAGDPPRPAETNATIARGAYLSNALGHCGQCHTPRTALYALDTDRWMAGAPSLGGRGFVPNLTPSGDGLGDWSAGDIAYLLETGFTPDFDSIGGDMAAVVDAWSQLPASDREAVAAYLEALEPLPSARRD